MCALPAEHEVEGRVCQVLAALFGLDEDEVGLNTSNHTISDWDSLKQLLVIQALEEEFDVRFDDEETGLLVNVPVIVEIVTDRLSSS
jgi:acyl carrier protein